MIQRSITQLSRERVWVKVEFAGNFDPHLALRAVPLWERDSIFKHSFTAGQFPMLSSANCLVATWRQPTAAVSSEGIALALRRMVRTFAEDAQGVDRQGPEVQCLRLEGQRAIA